MKAQMMPESEAYAQPPLATEYDDDQNSSGGLEDFSFVCAVAASSPIPADQIFHNGIIKPINVQFQQPFLSSSPPPPPPKPDEISNNTTATATAKISKRKALRRLFTEERPRHPASEELVASESVVSPSSDLDSVPSDTYCVWEPKTGINGKGNSKRWRLRDLLTRNVSSKDGQSRRGGIGIVNNNRSKINNDDDEETPQPQQAVRKTAIKEGGGSGRRSTYLPYRQELVGIFGSNATSFLRRF